MKKKYWLVFKNSFQDAIVYRFDTISALFAHLFSFAAFFYLWHSIYRQDEQIGSYTLGSLISYYLVTNLLNLIIKNEDIAWIISDEIRLGEISNIILKPLNYTWFVFARALGKASFSAITYTLAMTLIFYALGNRLETPKSFSVLVFFIFFAITGFFISFFVKYLVGLCSFWFGMIWGFNFTFSLVASFLDGSFVPLDLIPEPFSTIVNILPFKYIIFIPISIFTNRMEPSLHMFIIPLLWIILFYLMTRFVLQRGLKKYEGYGI